MPASMMQLGRVVDLELDTGRKIRPRGQSLLAWGRRNLHLCIPHTGRAALSPAVAAKHRRFHGANPNGGRLAECPDPIGGLRLVGLLRAVTYRAAGIASPAKKRYAWRHVFGDRGHAGEENQPPARFPALMTDAKGRLFIRRRKGNTYYVGAYKDGVDYIIG